MCSAFRLELGKGAPTRCDEERATGHAVVVGRLLVSLYLFQKGGTKPAAAALCVVLIKAADPVCQVKLNVPLQAALRGRLARAVRLLAHNTLGSQHGVACGVDAHG